MTKRDGGRSELDGALAALDLVARYVAEGSDRFIGSPDRQLALVFLWANIGSHLKQYARNTHIEVGVGPFARPIQMRDRLIYGSVRALDPTIVWQTCVADGPALRQLIIGLRAAY